LDDVVRCEKCCRSRFGRFLWEYPESAAINNFRRKQSQGNGSTHVRNTSGPISGKLILPVRGERKNNMKTIRRWAQMNAAQKGFDDRNGAKTRRGRVLTE
jgi:hypothetical protein